MTSLPSPSLPTTAWTNRPLASKNPGFSAVDRYFNAERYDINPRLFILRTSAVANVRALTRYVRCNYPSANAMTPKTMHAAAMMRRLASPSRSTCVPIRVANRMLISRDGAI